MNNARYFEIIDTVVNNHLEQATGTDIRTLPPIGVVAEVGCKLLRRGRLPGPGRRRRLRRAARQLLGRLQGRALPGPTAGDEAAAEGTFVHVYVDNTDPARPVTPIPEEIRAAVASLVRS